MDITDFQNSRLENTRHRLKKTDHEANGNSSSSSVIVLFIRIYTTQNS